MTQELVETYRKLHRMHAIVYAQVHKAKDAAPTMTQGDRVDRAFILKRMAELFKDLEKETRLAVERLNTCTAMVYTKDSLESETIERSIHGKIAVGTPDSKLEFRMPSHSKEPEKYAALLEALGVPSDVVTAGALQPHFIGVQAYINALLAAGKNPPPGVKLEDAYPVYTVALRAQRGFDPLVTPVKETPAADADDAM